MKDMIETADGWSECAKRPGVMPEAGKDPRPVKALFDALKLEYERLAQYWGESSLVCRDLGVAMMGLDAFYFDLTGERLVPDAIELFFCKAP